MIKLKNAIGRIGVSLAIIAGLSLGAPIVSFAQEEFDTSQVSSVTQNADSGIATCVNNADTGFSFQCSGTSATGYRRKDNSSSLYINILGYSGKPLRLYVDGAYNTNGSGGANCTEGVYRSNHYGKWEMYNQVRESGRSAARLTAWAESGYGTVNGVWSPDCVGRVSKLPA